MLMGSFLNGHYWPATAFPKVDVCVTFPLDVNDSCTAKLRCHTRSMWWQHFRNTVDSWGHSYSLLLDFLFIISGSHFIAQWGG